MVNIKKTCCQTCIRPPTTLGTTQKRLSWADDHLMKHLYKTQTKSGSWQVFSFYSRCKYFITSKDLPG